MSDLPPRVPWEQPLYQPAVRDEVLFTVGDIGVSRYWVVTPSGSVPLAETRWVCRDQTHVQRVMPGYAVVLAVVFFLFCLLGLLALAIREDRFTGTVEIHVTGPDGFFHVCQVHVRSIEEVHYFRQMVARAQTLAASARESYY